jgi:hypothetical protein
MRIEHDLSADDLATCNAMTLAASPPTKNRPVAVATAVYGVGGALALGYFFDLSFWGYMALWAYALGLVWLIVLALKLSAAGQIKQMAREASMKREYLITDAGLEVRMPDLTQVFPFGGIVRVESRERGTVVHLSKSPPMFLPFGSAFRSDFVEALREKAQKG